MATLLPDSWVGSLRLALQFYMKYLILLLVSFSPIYATSKSFDNDLTIISIVEELLFTWKEYQALNDTEYVRGRIHAYEEILDIYQLIK